MPVTVSQADRMLELLQDGRWHSIGELFDHGIGRPNSRAAQLRATRGVTIEHRRDPAEKHPSRLHQYRLVVEPRQLTLEDAA